MTAGASLQVDTTAVPVELQPWLESVTTSTVESGEVAFRLRMVDGALTLDAPASGLGDLRVELAQGSTGYRAARARGERLVRACAVRSGTRVVDATGGLGTDAWLLASAGAEVLVLERHPVVAALLADGLRRRRGCEAGVVDRIRLELADSRERLRDSAIDADVIYLDPMYPQRRKAALGTRRMRLLAALFAAGGEVADDVGGLVAAALATQCPRVVLKRPLKAPLPPGLPGSGYSLTGRSTRFDVWYRPRPEA